MEALTKYRIPGEQMQCLLFIIRKTYGWHKKEDAISITQFEKATGMKRSHVCRAIAELSRKNLVSTNKGTRVATKYQFNKKYKTWERSTKKDTSPQKGTGVVPKKVHTIDTITKDIKKIYKRKIPDVFPLTNNLKNYAFKKGIFKNEVEDIFEHFKNHHGAKGTLMLDWDKCWYTWVRNEIKFNPEKYADRREYNQESIKELCS